MSTVNQQLKKVTFEPQILIREGQNFKDPNRQLP